MDAIIRFLQDTGFYLFSQDGNWRCLIMLGIACVLLYLGIVKKFEPLLLVPIAFGMLITNLPGANMFHEIFFAGGHIHWDLIGGQPVTASLLADLHSQGVAENVLAPYIQQLMTAAQTAFSPEMVEQAIAAVTEEAGAAITALEAQLQALVQAELARTGEEYTEENAGFKAQCVSYILGKEFGVDVSGYAFEAPADFLRTDDPQTIRAELTDIRDTAYDISTRMMRSLEQSKAPRLSEQER